MYFYWECAKKLKDEQWARVLSTAAAIESLRDMRFLVIADDHRFDVGRCAARLLLRDLGTPDLALALEAIPTHHGVKRLGVDSGWESPEAALVQLGQSWPWPITSYLPVFQLAHATSIPVIGIGPVNQRARESSRDRDRRPLEIQRGPALRTQHKRMVAAIESAKPSVKAETIVILVGSSHVFGGGSDSLASMLGDLGKNVAVLVAGLPDWEIVVRQKSKDLRTQWIEIVPGVFRAPYCTEDAEIVAAFE